MTIVQLLNQNSFLLVAGIALGGALIALIARRAHLRMWLVWIAAVAAAAVLNAATRTTPARAFESAAEVERFDAEHRRLLEAIAPDSFTVLHQMTIHVYVRNGMITTVSPGMVAPRKPETRGVGESP